MINFLRISVFILFFLVLANGIVMCFITFAVVPGEYNESVYTKEQVADIALKERSAGISLVYDLNRNNFNFVYIPMIILILVYAVLQVVERNKIKR